MHTIYLIILMLSAAFFTIAGTFALWWALRQKQVVDIPNERSNHSHPVVKGVGLAMSLSLLAFLAVAGMDGDLLLGLLALTVISFLDDIYEIEVKWRLIVQVIVVMLGVSAIDGMVFQDILPLWLEIPLIIVLWLWFINLYNFMDGIDGITTANTASLCVALVALFFSVDGLSKGVYIDAAMITAAVLAFAPFNWHPAKLFMGDAGSIPLGFLLGYLLLQTAADGYPLAALIIPAVYITDATITIARRLLRKEKIWIAHSEHYYQQAVRLGMAHDEVVKHIIAANFVLAVLAVIAAEFPLPTGLVCLALAYGGSFLLLQHLTGRIRLPFLPHAHPKS